MALWSFQHSCFRRSGNILALRFRRLGPARLKHHQLIINIRVIVFMQVFRLKLESVWSVDICGRNFRFSQKIRVIVVVDFFSPDR